MASHSRYFRDGVVAGLIGAALVAVWFLIYDAASGRPFRTPALLGAATFQGVTDPAAVPTTAHLVVQYTVLHGVVFALLGVLIAYLIASAQREPSRVLTLFIALMCFEVFFLALMTWLAHPVLDELAWWAILIANALAAGGMLIYFFIGHARSGAPCWARSGRAWCARASWAGCWARSGSRSGSSPTTRRRGRRSAPRPCWAPRSSTACVSRERS
jgi:hypothetical protein